MHCSFIQVFDSQLNKVENINDKNEESLKLVQRKTLKELDAAGRMVDHATYQELQSLSFLIVDLLQPLFPTSVNKVSIYLMKDLINYY